MSKPKKGKRKIKRKVDLKDMKIEIHYVGTNMERDKKRWEILKSAIFSKLGKSHF